MQIYNALDLKDGKKVKNRRLWSISQPLQFLPIKEKDPQWAAENLDWLEWQGLKQIRANARKFMKNYKIAAGMIDRSDYIAEENNDMRDLVEQLADDTEVEALELKFYPLVPSILNTIIGEFAARQKRVSFRATDDLTHNDILEQKKIEIEHLLIARSEAKLAERMIQMGADPNDPDISNANNRQAGEHELQSLPEIQEFYAKDYEIIVEKWASKQHLIDEERFRMEELEKEAFRDKLTVDREFWHFNMYEDDYGVELWNPVLTFYHKSQKTRYISEGNFVGKIELMTAADVIDELGWKMNEEQLYALNRAFPHTEAPGYSIGGYQNDGTFYDATRSHGWNVGPPSLAMRQYLSFRDNYVHNGNDIIDWILNETEDNFLGPVNLFRVTTAYWKSQRKVGHLTKIAESGEVTTSIVTEEHTVTDSPVYNTTLIRNKTAHNLLFGEHIEWVWINHVYGGIKIGPNTPTVIGYENSTGIDPIYIGINQNQIKPLKFQFKGDRTLYGCRLPVEGRVFTDRNSKSWSLVDALKPFQIGYNIVNNQIADILVDELGTIIALDHNALPRHSLGEDWGKGNYAKAYVAMKDFSILPLDTTINNTENALNFQHYQKLDMSQTERVLSRTQLAVFFKQQAFEQVGVSPNRMGQAIGKTTSATEAEQQQVGSYAQTEDHFIQHCDELMPRVHEMRTNLAQWYHANNPSVRLQHVTSNDERINLTINGTDLLLRDLNVFSTANANVRQLLDKLKLLAINNNTSGASIYDLGHILQADSIGTINTALKMIDQKAMQQRQEEMQHEEKLEMMRIQQEEKDKMLERDHEALESERDRRKDILVAEIRASGFGAMVDLNENKQSDFLDNLEKIKRTEAYEEGTNIQREKNAQNQSQHSDKMDLKRDEMALRREESQNALRIAQENKNRYDVPKAPKKEDKKKTKKS